MREGIYALTELVYLPKLALENSDGHDWRFLLTLIFTQLCFRFITYSTLSPIFSILMLLSFFLSCKLDFQPIYSTNRNIGHNNHTQLNHINVPNSRNQH